MLQSNAKQLARRWERSAAALGPTMRNATKEATRVVFQESKKQMKALIDNKPVPTKGQIAQEKNTTVMRGGVAVPATWVKINGKSVKVPLRPKDAKKKAWKRTGNLRRSEDMQVVNKYLGLVVNTAKYAAARHAMGTPEAKKYKRCRYPAPWRTEAVKRTRIRVRNIYRRALREAMTTGLVSGPGGL